MVKIGILTFHRSVNNGAVLQAYSLSHRLMAEYPDVQVEVIDYHMKKVADNYRYSVYGYIKDKNPVAMIKKAVKLMLRPGTIRRLNKRNDTFESVINELPLSDFTLVDDSTDQLFEYISTTYDVLIVGSDAVWNYLSGSRGFPNAYFPDERVGCRKFSYAASCYGMEFTKYAVENKSRIKEIMDGFTFIGARDKATEDFVKWSGSVTVPYHTCDPTAFLDVDSLPVDAEALRQKMRNKGVDFARPTIGMMGTEDMGNMLRKIFGRKYQIISLFEYVGVADVNLCDLTPYEWAYVHRCFNLTFTTAFHGTMLSLRHGVPVICISLPTEFAQKHDAKTLDLLKRLGYSDWYLSTDYKGRGYEEIKTTALRLLSGDYKDEIISRMNKEAESFNTFKEALDKALNED